MFVGVVKKKKKIDTVFYYKRTSLLLGGRVKNTFVCYNIPVNSWLRPKKPFIHYYCAFQESIAYLPLIMSISAAMSSIFSKKLVQKIGSKVMVGNEDK